MESLQTVYLHTGSNLGPRAIFLARARELIEERVGKILQVSHVYETEAWGMKDQPNFYNQALEVQTHRSPEEVLEIIKVIEKEIGRTPSKKWHERIIDIDIIFFGEQILETENLKIPHPHCHERLFVLIPMIEIAGDVMHPVFQKTMDELFDECDDELEVFLIEK